MPDPQEDYSQYDEPPFNPLPKAVIALVAIILGIEVLFTLGARGIIGGPDAIGWRLAAVQDWAFADVVWEWMLANGRYPPEQLVRFVTYQLIHVNFTHALFVIVFILAMGKLVSEVFGTLAFLTVFILSSVFGALAYAVLLKPLGFVPTSFLFLLGLIKLFSARSWGFSISAAAGSVALIYIIFRLVFSVLMPAGIVPEGEVLAAIGHLFGAAK